MSNVATLERPIQEPLVLNVEVEMAGRSTCDSCPHARNQHSNKGCIWEDIPGNRSTQCMCQRTYMDL